MISHIQVFAVAALMVASTLADTLTYVQSSPETSGICTYTYTGAPSTVTIAVTVTYTPTATKSNLPVTTFLTPAASSSATVATPSPSLVVASVDCSTTKYPAGSIFKTPSGKQYQIDCGRDYSDLDIFNLRSHQDNYLGCAIACESNKQCLGFAWRTRPQSETNPINCYLKGNLTGAPINNPEVWGGILAKEDTRVLLTDIATVGTPTTASGYLEPWVGETWKRNCLIGARDGQDPDLYGGIFKSGN